MRPAAQAPPARRDKPPPAQAAPNGESGFSRNPRRRWFRPRATADRCAADTRAAPPAPRPAADERASPAASASRKARGYRSPAPREAARSPPDPPDDAPTRLRPRRRPPPSSQENRSAALWPLPQGRTRAPARNPARQPVRRKTERSFVRTALSQSACPPPRPRRECRAPHVRRRRKSGMFPEFRRKNKAAPSNPRRR